MGVGVTGPGRFNSSLQGLDKGLPGAGRKVPATPQALEPQNSEPMQDGVASSGGRWRSTRTRRGLRRLPAHRAFRAAAVPPAGAGHTANRRHGIGQALWRGGIPVSKWRLAIDDSYAKARTREGRFRDRSRGKRSGFQHAGVCRQVRDDRFGVDAAGAQFHGRVLELAIA